MTRVGAVTVEVIGGFARPFSVGFDHAGRLLVADMDRDRVERFGAGLEWEATLGGREPGWSRSDRPGNGSGLLRGPHSTVLDERGLLYVTEYAARRVSVLDPEGTLIRRVGDGTRGAALLGPASAEIAPDGALVVVDYAASALVRFDAEGRCTGCLGEGEDGRAAGPFRPWVKTIESSNPGGLRRPHMARWGPDERLYVADTWNHRVQRFDPDGGWAGWLGATTEGPTGGWVTSGVAVESAQPGGLRAPVALDLQPDGSLLVTDWGNHRVQWFDRDGACRGWVGGREGAEDDPVWRLEGSPAKGASPASFDRPYDARFRGSALYVADTHNQRVQVVRLGAPPH